MRKIDNMLFFFLIHVEFVLGKLIWEGLAFWSTQSIILLRWLHTKIMVVLQGWRARWWSIFYVVSVIIQIILCALAGYLTVDILLLLKNSRIKKLNTLAMVNLLMKISYQVWIQKSFQIRKRYHKRKVRSINNSRVGLKIQKCWWHYCSRNQSCIANH